MNTNGPDTPEEIPQLSLTTFLRALTTPHDLEILNTVKLHSPRTCAKGLIHLGYEGCGVRTIEALRGSHSLHERISQICPECAATTSALIEGIKGHTALLAHWMDLALGEPVRLERLPGGDHGFTTLEDLTSTLDGHDRVVADHGYHNIPWHAELLALLDAERARLIDLENQAAGGDRLAPVAAAHAASLGVPVSQLDPTPVLVSITEGADPDTLRMLGPDLSRALTGPRLRFSRELLLLVLPLWVVSAMVRADIRIGDLALLPEPVSDELLTATAQLWEPGTTGAFSSLATTLVAARAAIAPARSSALRASGKPSR